MGLPHIVNDIREDEVFHQELKLRSPANLAAEEFAENGPSLSRMYQRLPAWGFGKYAASPKRGRTISGDVDVDEGGSTASYRSHTRCEDSNCQIC